MNTSPELRYFLLSFTSSIRTLSCKNMHKYFVEHVQATETWLFHCMLVYSMQFNLLSLNMQQPWLVLLWLHMGEATLSPVSKESMCLHTGHNHIHTAKYEHQPADIPSLPSDNPAKVGAEEFGLIALHFSVLHSCILQLQTREHRALHHSSQNIQFCYHSPYFTDKLTCTCIIIGQPNCEGGDTWSHVVILPTLPK